MKKRTVLALLSLMFAVTSQAQQVFKYQGDVEAGFAAGVGLLGFDRINLHTTHGVRFNEYFFLGAGGGLDCFTNYIYDLPELSLPVYLNTKGYLPISSKTNMFLSFDIGTSIGLTEGVKGVGGLLLTPSLGFNFKIRETKSINVSLGYNYQQWGDGILSVNNDAVAIKLGFQF